MNKIYSLLLGLFGLNLVIIIHELGHLGAAHICSIEAPLFSIGFGPTVAALEIGNTLFQLAVLPFGGYVMINHTQLAATAYYIQCFVILAGIGMNICFAALIFAYLRLFSLSPHAIITRMQSSIPNGLIGPIGILFMISSSAQLGLHYFLFMLATLSLSIGLFNFIPLPFLDGGQLLWYTAQVLVGPLDGRYFETLSSWFAMIALGILLLLSIKDSRRWFQ